MNVPRATRILESLDGRRVLLGQWLPLGSLKRRLFFWLFVPFALLFTLLVVFDQLIMPTVVRRGTEFAVPVMVNKKLADAQITLHELGLEAEVASREYAPGKAEGIILSQYPVGGTKVKSGRTVKFVVAAGPKMVRIPEVTGKSVRQAMLDLESAGLILGEIAWAFSDTIPERVVVFSYPAAGAEVLLGGTVNLMVNRGRASDFTFVPRVIGLPLPEATKRLTEKWLRVGNLKYRKDEELLPESVLEQSEPEGAEVLVNSEIDLVVTEP